MFRRNCLRLAPLRALLPATAQEVKLEPTADGGVTITTALYVGTIRKDGYLHSLKVAGTELLEDKVGFSTGSYLLHGGNKAAELGAPRVIAENSRTRGGNSSDREQRILQSA